MGLGQYNGSNPGSFEDVYYVGTGTLTVGQIVGFSTDATNNPTSIPAGSLVVPPTSSVLPRDILGREVGDIDTTNYNIPAGVISDLRALPGGVGPGWITIQKTVPGDVCDIYCKFSATLNSDIVGSGTGGLNTAVSLGTGGTYSGSGRVLGIAMQTVDRSTTAGLVRCKFI
jgi:hypothetical protein